MLERLVRGWRGKSLVLLLLGFAATDFVMVKTISVADAAVHVIGNQYEPWQDTLAFVAEWSKACSQPNRRCTAASDMGHLVSACGLAMG